MNRVMKRKYVLGAVLCALLALAAVLPAFTSGASAADIDPRKDFGVTGLTPRGDGSYYGPAAYGNRITYNEKVYLNPCEIELKLRKYDCNNDFWYAVLFNVGRNSYIGSEDVLGVMIRIYPTGLEYTAIGKDGMKKSESKTTTVEVKPDNSRTLSLKLKAELADGQIKFTVTYVPEPDSELTVTDAQHEIIVADEQYVTAFARGAFLSVGFNHMNQLSFTSEFEIVDFKAGTRTDAEIVYGSAVSENDKNMSPLLGVGKPYRTSLKVPMIVLLSVGGAGLAASIVIFVLFVCKNKKNKGVEEK